MTKVMLTVMAITAHTLAAPQNLLDTYKAGHVNLVPDTTFANDCEWPVLFGDYNAKKYGNPIGMYKSLAVTSDGAVFVANYSKYSIYTVSYTHLTLPTN